MFAFANELTATANGVVTDPSISDLLSYDFSLLGASTAGLAGFLIILTAVLRPLLAKVGLKLDGFYAYLLPVGLGVVLGAALQLTGALFDPQYIDLPKPLGGLVFGLFSGLTAVGLHQGGKQAKETQLRTAAARARR